MSNICVGVYDIEDTSENGMIETVDTLSGDRLGEICGNFQLGEILTFDVTAAVEHDLFDSGQTHFSGFVITGGNYTEFYDHTDPVHGPRLTVSDTASDCDGIPDDLDNCIGLTFPSRFYASAGVPVSFFLCLFATTGSIAPSVPTLRTRRGDAKERLPGKDLGRGRLSKPSGLPA